MSRGAGLGVTIDEILQQPIPVTASFAETFYKTQVYFDGDDIYVCQAVAGTALGDPLWQVEKFNTASDISGIFADGVDTFTKSATDLATVKAYSYAV
jgi:hypothetical protein